jgi:hypothetical protein
MIPYRWALGGIEGQLTGLAVTSLQQSKNFAQHSESACDTAEQRKYQVHNVLLGNAKLTTTRQF